MAKQLILKYPFARDDLGNGYVSYWTVISIIWYSWWLHLVINKISLILIKFWSVGGGGSGVWHSDLQTIGVHFHDVVHSLYDTQSLRSSMNYKNGIVSINTDKNGVTLYCNLQLCCL